VRSSEAKPYHQTASPELMELRLSETFSGNIDGQGSEIVANGSITSTWFVVPGSGTGELSGLRGEGGFKGDFGKGSEGTLDYWFE